jgi:hypothetical protein
LKYFNEKFPKNSLNQEEKDFLINNFGRNDFGDFQEIDKVRVFYLFCENGVYKKVYYEV